MTYKSEISAALDSETDEVLVVGHSSGAYLAVSILADLVRERVPREGEPSLAFFSLRQVVPMVLFLPKADRVRRDLACLSESDRLTWVDVTAPGDGCAFALCDPVSVSGLATPAKRWPLVISVAFTKTLSPERWRALRWKFFRFHFQYLCAFDRPGHMIISKSPLARKAWRNGSMAEIPHDRGSSGLCPNSPRSPHDASAAETSEPAGQCLAPSL